MVSPVLGLLDNSGRHKSADEKSDAKNNGRDEDDASDH